jgi:CRP/FNR family cyclic AMP-dependent transcriptional regulator
VTVRRIHRPLDSEAAGPLRRSTVALLRADAGLRAAVPAEQRPFAERVLVAPCHELPAGPWSPATLTGGATRPLGALLLRGIVTHDLLIAGRCSMNLIGPGDVFRPWQAVDTSVPCEVRWSVTGDAAVALLDERFLAATRRWPGLSAVVYERLAEQLEAATMRAAIVALPRVEERLLALFWQLADRWGVVRPEGVVIELALTHALIGNLVGAQRPTVSLALHALASSGLLLRSDTGAWTLSHESLSALGGGADRYRPPCARPLSLPARDSGVPPAG